jgi:hypothetical protein
VRAKSILEVVYRLELRTERTAVRTTKFMTVPDPGIPILSKARVNGLLRMSSVKGVFHGTIQATKKTETT